MALSSGEAQQIAKYVLSLGSVVETSLPGNAARGKTLYETKGGAPPATLFADRAEFGPELTEIGLRRNANYLRESLVKPAATVPEGFLMVTGDHARGENRERNSNGRGFVHDSNPRRVQQVSLVPQGRARESEERVQDQSHAEL
jgi:hypothetical protein